MRCWTSHSEEGARLPVIEGFVWDDENEDKVWVHGLRPGDIDSMLDSTHVVRRNRKDRRGVQQVIGCDRGGRVITVIIEPVGVEGRLWRPVTAWPSKPSEARLLRK
jgi:hypothetical protein